MNYMKEVAKMLGVELGEEFKVEEYDDFTFKLTEDGLNWICNKGWQSGYFTLEDILCDRIEIIKNTILNEAEKEYLSAVIKPFRDCVISITKRHYSNSYEIEYISVTYVDRLIDNSTYIFPLPNFKSGTMYKGMEAGKHYTLKELGL